MADEKRVEQAREARKRAEEDYRELVEGRTAVKEAAKAAADIRKDDIAALVMLAFGRG